MCSVLGVGCCCLCTSGDVPLVPVAQFDLAEKLQDVLNSTQALRLTVWSNRLLSTGSWGGDVELGCRGRGKLGK